MVGKNVSRHTYKNTSKNVYKRNNKHNISIKSVNNLKIRKQKHTLKRNNKNKSKNLHKNVIAPSQKSKIIKSNINMMDGGLFTGPLKKFPNVIPSQTPSLEQAKITLIKQLLRDLNFFLY